MDTASALELFGYLGSLIVIVSMLMTSVVKLRVINTVGSLMFSAYALMIHSYPTMVMNLFLAGINIWHLMKLHNTGKNYDMVSVSVGSGIVKYILDYFQDDIAKFFPDFHREDMEGCQGFLVLCQSSPAGLMIAGKAAGGTEDGGETGSSPQAGELKVILDYTTPTYRDCSVGRFLYRSLGEMGYTSLIMKKPGSSHYKYLKKMGFRKTEEEGYSLDLKG